MNSSVTSISLSPDNTHAAISFDHSFHLYSLVSMKRVFQKDSLNYRINKCCVSEEGNMVALLSHPIIGIKSVYKVFVWGRLEDDFISELEFKEKIMNISISRDLLLVVMLNSICLCDITKGTQHHQIITADNPFGAGDIAESHNTMLIAVCGLQIGTLTVYECKKDSEPLTFRAHVHSVSAIKFSRDSSIIATAGEKGTLIRLFDSSTGGLLYVFRRGTLASRILSLAMAPSNSYLLAISESGTIHLFDSSIRKAENSEPQRAAIKHSVERDQHIIASVMLDDKFCMLTSSGHYFIFKKKGSSLEVESRVFLFAH